MSQNDHERLNKLIELVDGLASEAIRALAVPGPPAKRGEWTGKDEYEGAHYSAILDYDALCDAWLIRLWFDAKSTDESRAREMIERIINMLEASE